MSKSRWNDLKKAKPKLSGFYYCIVSGKDHNGKKPYHKILFYDTATNAWCDHERMIMFEQYDVYKTVEGPDGKEALERIYKDALCIRTDVLYWKKQSAIPH